MAEFDFDTEQFWERHNAEGRKNSDEAIAQWKSFSLEEKEQFVIRQVRFEQQWGRFWDDLTDPADADYFPGQKEYLEELAKVERRLRREKRL